MSWDARRTALHVRLTGILSLTIGVLLLVWVFSFWGMINYSSQYVDLIQPFVPRVLLLCAVGFVANSIYLYILEVPRHELSSQRRRILLLIVVVCVFGLGGLGFIGMLFTDSSSWQEAPSPLLPLGPYVMALYGAVVAVSHGAMLISFLRQRYKGALVASGVLLLFALLSTTKWQYALSNPEFDEYVQKQMEQPLPSSASIQSFDETHPEDVQSLEDVQASIVRQPDFVVMYDSWKTNACIYGGILFLAMVLARKEAQEEEKAQAV